MGFIKIVLFLFVANKKLLTYLLTYLYDKNNIGLYRDDGLAVFKNISVPQAEKFKKHFQNIFRKNDLNIIVKCNLEIVDYLDVTPT